VHVFDKLSFDYSVDSGVNHRSGGDKPRHYIFARSLSAFIDLKYQFAEGKI